MFPDRPVTERRVAFSTGLLNLWSSAHGGIPMCHGASSMAGHVQFGARMGGASIMLGALVLAVGLFPAGVQLAPCSKEAGPEKVDRFVVLTTAAFTVWSMGIAGVFGFLEINASKRGCLQN